LLCVAIVVVWLGLIFARVHRYETMVSKIKSLNGMAFPESAADGDLTANRFSLARELFGDAAVEEIGWVSLQSDSVSDRDLALLHELPRLKVLGLGRGITDEGLRIVSRRPLLRTVLLTDSKVTARGVAQLEACMNLEEVALEGDFVTDDVVATLHRFPGLRICTLKRGKFTSQGFPQLAKLKRLERLRLRSSFLTGEGLQSLADMDQLEELDLGGSPIMDEGLSSLRGNRSIKRLGLAESKVTNAGMEHVATLSQLQQIDLGLTDVSADGLKKLEGLKSLRMVRVGPEVSKAEAEQLVASRPGWKIRLVDESGQWTFSVPPERFGPPPPADHR
jgi:hypothetical protein